LNYPTCACIWSWDHDAELELIEFALKLGKLHNLVLFGEVDRGKKHRTIPQSITTALNHASVSQFQPISPPKYKDPFQANGWLTTTASGQGLSAEKIYHWTSAQAQAAIAEWRSASKRTN